MRQRGITFVTTLAILAAMIALVVAFGETQRSATREQGSRSERTRARLAAEAGIQRALVEIEAVATGGNVPTTKDDSWATLGQNGAERFQLINSSFRVQIADLAGRLDINTVPQEGLTNLGLTNEQVDSLLDWREPGLTARAEGAKDDYYMGLPDPYHARLGPLQTIDELLLVKGFSPKVLDEADALYQNSTAARPAGGSGAVPPLRELATVIAYAPNATPNGDARQNLNSPTLTAQLLQNRLQLSPQLAGQILAARATQPNNQFPRLSTVLALPGVSRDPNAIRQILDNANTSPATRLNGRVNVNTASVEVLAAIPGVGTDLAQTILSRQTSGGMTRLSDVAQISTTPAFLASVADRMSVASQSFEVRAIGEAGGTKVAITATVAIENGALRVTRLTELPFNDMASRWQWDDVATTTTLAEAN